jgi:hypothetical protein
MNNGGSLPVLLGVYLGCLGTSGFRFIIAIQHSARRPHGYEAQEYAVLAEFDKEGDSVLSRIAPVQQSKTIIITTETPNEVVTTCAVGKPSLMVEEMPSRL